MSEEIELDVLDYIQIDILDYLLEYHMEKEFQK